MAKLDEIRQRLQDRRLDVIAERTGISRNTLYRIRQGLVENPEYETVRRLEEYLRNE
jgi:transcriptional regulator with XRE-family HTH domain